MVNANEIQRNGAFARRADGEDNAAAQIAADKIHARQLAELLHRFRMKTPYGLAGILAIIHINLNDVHAAHQNHVLADFVAHFPAKHGEGYECRYAKGNGKDYPKAALAHNLSQAYAKKIGHRYHACTCRNSGADAKSAAAISCMPCACNSLSGIISCKTMFQVTLWRNHVKETKKGAYLAK